MIIVVVGPVLLFRAEVLLDPVTHEGAHWLGPVSELTRFSWGTTFVVARGEVQASSTRSPTSLVGCTGALTNGCEREHRHQGHTRIIC